MGSIKAADPVKLFCGIIAVDEPAIARVQVELAARYGRIDHESELIPFNFTDYYGPEMGASLLRKFVAFADPIDPARIVDIKIETNAIEEQSGEIRAGALHRRVNLDPGYLAPEKLVLATTKNFAHRLYLGRGIYAEVTLNFARNKCTFHPWTYRDYQSEAYTAYFLKVRQAMLKEEWFKGRASLNPEP